MMEIKADGPASNAIQLPDRRAFAWASLVVHRLRADEFTIKLASEPFPARSYKRIAVEVVDVYGNESTVLRDLA